MFSVGWGHTVEASILAVDEIERDGSGKSDGVDEGWGMIDPSLDQSNRTCNIEHQFQKGGRKGFATQNQPHNYDYLVLSSAPS